MKGQQSRQDGFQGVGLSNVQTESQPTIPSSASSCTESWYATQKCSHSGCSKFSIPDPLLTPSLGQKFLKVPRNAVYLHSRHAPTPSWKWILLKLQGSWSLAPEVLSFCQDGARTGSQIPDVVSSHGGSRARYSSSKLCCSSSLRDLNGHHVDIGEEVPFYRKISQITDFFARRNLGIYQGQPPPLQGKKLRSRKVEICPQSSSCLLVYSSLLNTEGEKNELGPNWRPCDFRVSLWPADASECNLEMFSHLHILEIRVWSHDSLTPASSVATSVKKNMVLIWSQRNRDLDNPRLHQMQLFLSGQSVGLCSWTPASDFCSHVVLGANTALTCFRGRHMTMFYPTWNLDFGLCAIASLWLCTVFCNWPVFYWVYLNCSDYFPLKY